MKSSDHVGIAGLSQSAR